MQIKTVAMIGIGSMGAYLAPRLMEAVGRENFRAIADGARKTRLDTEGITVNGTVYHFPTVTPREQGNPADLVIIAVKGTVLDEAIAQIANQVGERTVIMAVLNGVTSERQVAAVYGEEKVLPSFMRVSVVMENHVTNYDPTKGCIVFGENKNTTLSERVQAVSELFERAGIAYKIPEDMIQQMWHKFMANVGENLTSALLGIPFGGFQRSEHANFIRVEAMKEVSAVARKQGIDVGEKEMAIQEKILAGLPFPNKTSTLQDLEAGRKTEIDLFAGEMVRMGRELGIPTPYNELFYHAIKVLEQKNDGLFQQP